MATLARIHCYFGKHLRSRGRARRQDNGWHSYCRRCGVEMFKEDGGEWYVVPDIGADDDGLDPPLVAEDGGLLEPVIAGRHDEDEGEGEDDEVVMAGRDGATRRRWLPWPRRD